MRDVTHDPRYGFTQYVGRTRQIKQDYFLCTGTDIADYWLAAPGSDYPVPKSIEAYEREGPQSAAGYIRAGTRLRYKKLLYDEKQWNGASFWAVSEIVDGPHRGKTISEVW